MYTIRTQQQNKHNICTIINIMRLSSYIYIYIYVYLEIYTTPTGNLREYNKSTEMIEKNVKYLIHTTYINNGRYTETESGYRTKRNTGETSAIATRLQFFILSETDLLLCWTQNKPEHTNTHTSHLHREQRIHGAKKTTTTPSDRE